MSNLHIPQNKIRNEKGQFLKGFTPHNKGIKGYSNFGTFKKGHKPLNDALVLWRKSGGFNSNKGTRKFYNVVCKSCQKEFKTILKKQRFCSNSCKATYSNIHSPNKKFNDTKIELKMESLLKTLGIEYQKQVSLCKIARVDFFIPNKNLVIECDGCYWHGCSIHHPNRIFRQERDIKRDEVLIQNGIKVVRFWEHEINSFNFTIKQLIH